MGLAAALHDEVVLGVLEVLEARHHAAPAAEEHAAEHADDRADPDRRAVDRATGQPVSADAGAGITEAFIAGTQPGGMR